MVPVDLHKCELGKRPIRVALVVAHPDDETLWAGGLLLSNPEWSPFIVSLCRGKDADRAPRFAKALACLGAEGAMGDLNDDPEQTLLPTRDVKAAICDLLPGREYDLLLTHAPNGEYTRHRRHEEVSNAVRDLRREGVLSVERLCQFAYEDGGGAYAPRPRKEAQFHLALFDDVWARKRAIITGIYGFAEDSWEVRAVSRSEGFSYFRDRGALRPSRRGQQEVAP